MKIRHCVTFCVVLLFAYCVNAQETEMERFNEDYLESRNKLQELYDVKGALFDCKVQYHQNFAAEVVKMLSMFKTQSDSIGVLFYCFKIDTLKIWLVKKNKFYNSKAVVDKEHLSRLEKNIRGALDIDFLASEREMNLKRDITPRVKRNAGVSIDDAIAVATSILLPDGIAKNLSGLKHLMIVPELNIGRIPFYILKPFNSSSSLIDSVSVSIAPNLCNLNAFVNDRKYKIGEKNFYSLGQPLIVGNPKFSQDTEYRIPPLPGAEIEVNSVATILGGQSITGDSAKISSIIEKANYADLLYFATHGFFDFEKILKGSFLVFAPDSTNKTGFWTANDIQKHHFNADLAILSACQTGVGKIFDGGFVGIGRTFFTAGISNTVTSLWSVDDRSTVKLMEFFVQNLLVPDYFYPSEHLRQAILKYRKFDDNIAHWAPFIVYGFTY